jgi:toxin ParE1/3/4
LFNDFLTLSGQFDRWVGDCLLCARGEGRGGGAENVSYVAQDSGPAAERLLIQALEAASSLDIFSERGRIVPQLNQPNIRQLLIQRYRLLYEVTPSEVKILAFVHGARGIAGPGSEG